VTRPRLAVLTPVQERPHADTDAIISAVRIELAAVSHQAVYDVLRALTDAGLMRRIQPAGSVARYEARIGDNHHHVVCRSCGAIADVDCAVGETLGDDLLVVNYYRVRRHALLFLGSWHRLLESQACRCKQPRPARHGLLDREAVGCAGTHAKDIVLSGCPRVRADPVGPTGPGDTVGW
jgi:Fe2+ or Zn2+ uptake regulation protein